jgi:quercetin dioxygenase-like cupin family protein
MIPETSPHKIINDLEATLPEITPDSIVSRLLHDDERIKVTIFAFAGGQEMSEHTSTKVAILHILKGDAHIGVGEESVEARAGAWIHLPANLKHSVKAKTTLILLLTLLKT